MSEKPILEYQASRFKGGRSISPNVIRIWPDRVEEYEPHVVRKKTSRSIHFSQIAQISMRKGLRWTDIVVESTGGHQISLSGVPNRRAGKIKAEIDEAVSRFRAKS